MIRRKEIYNFFIVVVNVKRMCDCDILQYNFNIFCYLSFNKI